MRNRILSMPLILALLMVMSPVIFLFLPAQSVKAQQSPFLITPYYGSETITSLFDHEYPTYTGAPDNNNNIFTRYDGTRWVPPAPVEADNCNTGVNCYDGHNGYDFALSYERVLAAASGQVTTVRWWDPNIRGNGYGLYIEITHSNGYITRYGHLSAIAVSQGNYVTAGQIIGTSGNTGASGGAHLHFDVRSNDRAVDPFGWTGGGNDPWAVHASGATSWFMWSGGEWAGSPIPDPTPPGSPAIVVDDNNNNSNGFSKGRGGTFNNVCPPAACPYWYLQTVGYGNDSYYTYNSDTVDYWAKWQPTITKPGIYEVWVYVPIVGATSWQAKYTIMSDYGSHVAFGIDQEGLFNQWVCIGAYHFLNSSSRYYVYVTDATGESESLPRMVGVDAVKFVQRPTHPAYMPHTITDNGWTSQIVIRNDSNSEALLNKWDIKSDGANWCGLSAPFAARSLSISSGCGSLSVSTVADANQDISAVVENQKNSATEQTNYTAILPAGSAGSPGWEIAGDTLYAPLVKRNSYSRSSSIDIVNVGSLSTTVYVYYYDASGVSRSGGSATLAPNATTTFFPSGGGSGGCNASETLCSAKIYSSNGQPLAGVAREYNTTDNLVVTTHNLFSSGAASNYFPVMKYWYYGMTTGLQIQNVSSGSATITVYYYDQAGNPRNDCTHSISGIQPWSSRTFYDGPCLGSNFIGVAIATANTNIVGMANEVSMSGQNRKKAYSAFLSGTQTVYAPLVYGDQSSWTSGIAVQNVNSSYLANINVYYYDTAGNMVSSMASGISPNGMISFAPPAGLTGSAMITSDRPIVAVVNIVNKAGSGDTQAIYNASNR